jgi:hypothetical protein
LNAKKDKADRGDSSDRKEKGSGKKRMSVLVPNVSSAVSLTPLKRSGTKRSTMLVKDVSSLEASREEVEKIQAIVEEKSTSSEGRPSMRI